jgi:hypothetical protein
MELKGKMGTEGRTELRTVAIRIRRRDEIMAPEILLFFCLSWYRSYSPIAKISGDEMRSNKVAIL